jgi:ubiquinone/menaquinone biosynthesis C-methylase UbiE
VTLTVAVTIDARLRSTADSVRPYHRHMPPLRSATEVLAESLPLAGRDVVDVGCGDGSLVRWLRSQGARVTGVECGAEMLRRARAADPTGAYVDAGGQQLPFDDGSFDIVVYSYSLHHVPLDDIPAALSEARRVLRDDGALYVVEPAIDPPERSVGRVVTDETVERTAAQQALDTADRCGFGSVERFEYLSEAVHADFEAWADRLVGVDPDRAAALAEHWDAVAQEFHTVGERRPEGWAFQRLNLVAVLRP